MVSTSHPFGEQLSLFDLGGINMAQLRNLARSITAHSKASNTAIAYERDWRDFEAWCRRAGRESLPSTPDTLMLYLSDQAQRRAIATVNRRVCAISAHHKAAGQANPYTPEVKQFMAGARRKFGKPQQGKAALTVEQLRRICSALQKQKSVNAVRDQAMMVLGFAAGMRVSELVALEIGDIAFQKRGVRVFVAKSKTDQERRGREIGIFAGQRAATCPVRTLKRWLYVRGRQAGPLFTHASAERADTQNGLTTTRVQQIVKACVEMIGEDPAPYGPHSLRAGCVTAAIEAGMPESLVMQRTGHKSVQVLHRYVRPARLFRTDVLAGAL